MARTAARPPAASESDRAALAPLTADAVAAQADPASFKRGRGYARSRHIFNAVRRENTLRARCHGSSGGPYIVEATLARANQPTMRNPIAFACDCPRGDFCSRADRHLAACLDAQEGLPLEQRLVEDERARLIEAVMLIWQTDIDIGGVDLSPEGPEAIARAATPAEQQRVADELRGLIRPASGDDWNQTWLNKAAIGFLSLLGGEAGLSDEALLTEYRNAELWGEATEMLVQLDRVDEAVALASRRLSPANVLTAFADRLIATGDPKRIEQAITLVDDRLWEQEGQNAQHDVMLRQWLERRYAEHGNPEKALALARGRFKTSPSRETYDAVRTAALLPDQPDDPWPALRPALIDDLRKRGGWYALIDIHLAEGEVAEALDALKKTKKSNRNGQPAWGYGWDVPAGGYDARVAAAAEAEFPDESIQIYRRLADQLIAARGRASYQIAAGYLVRVMRLLEANGRAEEWRSLIAELRTENKSLRALKEELDSLGLG